jgi:hypothetical protein
MEAGKWALLPIMIKLRNRPTTKSYARLIILTIIME